MSPMQTLRGTLNSDGSLQLDSPPILPAGRVEIILRPLQPDSHDGGDWWEYLQRARSETEASGGPFRTAEDIEQDRESFRVDDRVDDLYLQIDKARKGTSAG